MEATLITRILRTACTVLFFAAAPSVHALGPHECAIIVNRRTVESIALANFYADLRQIPPANIVHLDLPDKALEAGASFTPQEFRELIYEPVQKTLHERGVIGHILAWVYSTDFPAIIETNPRLSLTGMTFVRGMMPPSAGIVSGEWPSPLFIGPDRANGPMSAAASLEEFTLRLGTNMPLPSMMLGWAGSRGLPVETIIENLKASASADGAHPSVSVYFETSEDIRSKTRAWQFEGAIKELAPLGVAGFAVSNTPLNRPDVMGLLAGRPSFSPGAYSAVRPGAYADHLTSFAAVFDDPDQTKLTEWLKLGAAGTSGTVTEPGSLTTPVILWTKFPHARLFAHYANGCTLLESLYQSIRCPLQILLVGDALASPWAKPPGITLVNMADDETAPISGKAEFLASSWGGFGQLPPTTIFFLNSRPINQPGTKSGLEMDTTRLSDGWHDLRVVVYANGAPVRHQAFNRTSFQTLNRGRTVTLSGYTPNDAVDLDHPLFFTITTEGSPIEAAVILQERVIARALVSNNQAVVSFPAQFAGLGPVSFQAVAVYPDKEPVRSEPLPLQIKKINQSPVITSVVTLTNQAGEQVLTSVAEDAESDAVRRFWMIDLLSTGERAEFAPDRNGAKEGADERGLTIAASGKKPLIATFNLDTPNRLREVSARFRFDGAYHVHTAHEAGVVFNYRDEDNYLFWGLNGHRSAWVLIRVEDGAETVVLTRGAPVNTGIDHEVAVSMMENGKMALYADQGLLALTDAVFTAGRVGVRNGKHEARYDQLLVSPVSAFRSEVREQSEDLVVTGDAENVLRSVQAAARDVAVTTLKPVR